MILADNSPHNSYFKPLARLPNKLSHTKSKISLQQMVTILGHPNKMILYLKLCMASSTVFHTSDYKPTDSKMLPAYKAGV